MDIAGRANVYKGKGQATPLCVWELLVMSIEHMYATRIGVKRNTNDDPGVLSRAG